jgi:glutathione synthase/RimK-type ligase-like ATP-grasp enzyme
MKAVFVLERGTPPRINPVFAETASLLEARGVTTRLWFPEHELTRIDRLSVDADVYLLKSNTSLAISLMTVAERLGARVVNRVSASQTVRDKVVTAAILVRAGVPAPDSVLASEPCHLAAAVATRPLIFKPHRGAYGRGIAVADSQETLPASTQYPDLVFAQDYLCGARTDLKVYAIGDELFGVRKAYGSDSYLDSGDATRLSTEVESIVRRTGEALGLELFGVDLAEDDCGVSVIDVNMTPGYRGVPDAPQRLAAYIERAGRHA